MRRFLSAILAFMICNFTIFSYVYAENETNNTANNTAATDLQTQRNEIQNQMNEANEQLQGVQSDISENLQQVQKLDEKISTSQQELDELNKKIENLQNSSNEVENRLTEVQGNYDKQKKLLDSYLVAVQESSETQYLDVLLASKNITEFLSNYFLITELANSQMELLEDMQNKKNEIQQSKEKLEKNQEELAVIKANQTKTATVLENTKSVRENFIAKLSDQEKSIQAQIDEYYNQFNAINNEILQLAQGGIATPYIGGVLAWPVPGYTVISSNYGMRTHPITGVYKLHTGVDIRAPLGATFIAANDGIVTKASYNGAYGNMVMIDHGGGVSTLYAHGSEILVQVGQTVKRGDTVLKVGSTGYSTGPHAHFEVRLNGVVTDPMPYITNGLVPQTQNKDENTENTNNTTN